MSKIQPRAGGAMSATRGRKGKSLFLLVLSAVAVAAGPQMAASERLTFNHSWGFDTPAQRNTKLAALDIEERKRGGYFQGFGTTIIYEGNTFITYDCTGSQATSTGNEALTTQDGTASSPSTGSQLETDTNSAGNESNTQQGSHLNGSSNTQQENTGSQTASTNAQLTNTLGALNASGGTTNQDAATNQDNSGTITANASGGTGCNFFETTKPQDKPQDKPQGESE